MAHADFNEGGAGTDSGLGAGRVITCREALGLPTWQAEGGCGGTYSNTSQRPLLYTHAELEECRNSTLELAALKIEELYKSVSASGFKSLSLRNTTIMYAKAIRAMKFAK